MTRSSEFRMVFNPVQAIGDPLGIWQAGPVRADEPAFVPEVTTWRVALPASQGRAEKNLRRNAARLHAARAALPQAEARLQDFTSQLPRKGLEYTLPSDSEYTAERDLQTFIARVQRTSSWSYSFNDLIPQISELMNALNCLAQNVRLSLASYASVESSRAGRLVGRTRVSWLGDFTNEWGVGLNPAQAGLHLQAVSQVLESRQSWVRIGLLVAAGAACLTSLAAGNPLAPLAVFQFVRQVIGEFQSQHPVM